MIIGGNYEAVMPESRDWPGFERRKTPVQSVQQNDNAQMKGTKAMIKKRSSLVEHSFGTFKRRVGMHHFLMRGLDCAEASLA